MSGERIRGVVFDVDGVLFDTERLSCRIWRQLSREMNWPQVGERYLEFVGRNRTDIRAKMEREFGPGFDQEEFLRQCTLRSRRELERGIPLKPGVREILEFLRQRQVPTALATSTEASRTLPRMEQTGLKEYFQVMITGDQVVHSKPDPEIYLLACRALGLPPGQTVAVEDSRNGILSAYAAGMLTVMVPDMIPPTPELDSLLYRRFDSLAEFQVHLSGIL